MWQSLSARNLYDAKARSRESFAPTFIYVASCFTVLVFIAEAGV